MVPTGGWYPISQISSTYAYLEVELNHGLRVIATDDLVLSANDDLQRALETPSTSERLRLAVRRLRELLDELKEFMEEKSSQAGMNMDVSSSRGNGSDGDTMSDERGSDEVAHANTPPRQHSDEGDEATRLVDETDRRRKHVDSGKVAILYSTDSFGSFTEQWSGTSKERRQVSHTQVSHTSLSHTHLSHKSLTHVSYTRLSHKSLTQVSHTILTTFNTQLLSHTHIVPGITAMYLTAMYLCATHHPSICISHRDASLFFSI